MSPRLLASPRLTLILLVALFAAVGAVVAGADQAFGHPGTHATTTTALLTTNRPGLKVCVESLVPDVDTQTIRGRVQGGLAAVANHPDYQAAGLGRQPVAVDAGCPARPTVADPRYRPSSRLGAPAAVTEPSLYRLFIFIASPEQIAQAFGDRPQHITAQELLCDGDLCPVVTTALYLTPPELRDPAVLATGLTEGVGLLPVGRPYYDTKPQPIDPRGK